MNRRTIRRKISPDDMVTLHVRRSIYNAVLELQALMQLKEHKRFSHSDIIQYSLGKLGELKIPLPEGIRVIFENNIIGEGKNGKMLC